jgi:uncharacterized repeat protein (TIGR01451 family)
MNFRHSFLFGATAIAATLLLGLSSGATVGAQEPPVDPCIEFNELSATDFSMQQAQELLCSIDVTKTLTSVNPVQVGGGVTFQIVVTNTGAYSLTNVSLADTYDPAVLNFTSAGLAPSDIDEGIGIILWEGLLPSPDGGDVGVWDSGESLTLTVSFTARAQPSAENCAIAIADVALGEEGPELRVESDLACADVRIVDAPDNPRRPRATSTAPANTPAPVSTVAAATVVPPTPRTGVLVSPPDTGTGGGGASGPISGGTFLAVVGALIAAAAGLTLVRKATN